jgi:hypothetical protein
MAWIACPDRLFSDPMTLRLAAQMGGSVTWAGGALLRLWCWCLEFAPDGDLRPFSPGEIAVAMGETEARGDQILAALVESRKVERKPYLRIHDWWEIVGLFLKGRYRQNPEIWQGIRDLYGTHKRPRKRKTAHDKLMSSSRATREQRTSNSQLSYPIVSYPSQPDNIHPPPLPSHARKRKDDEDDEGFNQFRKEIARMTGMRRFSEGDEERLRRILANHGSGVMEACSLLHSGIKNVPAYLQTVLEGKDDIEEVAKRVGAILKKGTEP